jgi:hypothetical protein
MLQWITDHAMVISGIAVVCLLAGGALLCLLLDMDKKMEEVRSHGDL